MGLERGSGFSEARDMGFPTDICKDKMAWSTTVRDRRTHNLNSGNIVDFVVCMLVFMLRCAGV